MRRLVIVAALLAGLMLPGSTGAQTATLPPIETNRVAVIGDSLTRGLFATHEQATFPALVADGLGMELGRFGVGGIEQAENAAQVIGAWRPELVIMQVGINDISRMGAEEWGERYRALVARFQAIGSEVVVSTLFVVAQDPNNPRRPLLSALNDEIWKTEGVRVADVWSATLNCPECMSQPGVPSPLKPRYEGDNFHPGDYGHGVMAQVILDTVRARVFIPISQSGDCHVR